MKADTTRIRLGETIHLELQLSNPVHVDVEWPSWLDSISGFEIVKISEPDTVPSENKSLLLRRQKVELTSFDSGCQVIPPVQFNFRSASGNKITVETDPVSIEVFTVQVDTTAEIKDIRPVVSIPPDYKMIALVTAGVLLLLLIVYLLYRRFRGKTSLSVAKPATPDVLPHERALRDLLQLESERLWQQGQFKLYHTRLTDILRQYIEDRWDVFAMELTTDDLLGHSLMHSLSTDNRSDLERILRLADLVKFARYTSIQSENEWALNQARQFVNDTTPSTNTKGDTGAESQINHVD